MRNFLLLATFIIIMFLSLCVEKAITNQIELNGYITGLCSGIIIVIVWFLILDWWRNK